MTRPAARENSSSAAGMLGVPQSQVASPASPVYVTIATAPRGSLIVAHGKTWRRTFTPSLNPLNHSMALFARGCGPLPGILAVRLLRIFVSQIERALGIIVSLQRFLVFVQSAVALTGDVDGTAVTVTKIEAAK